MLLYEVIENRDVITFLSFKPKLSDFLLDLRRSLAHKGFAKILNISTGMPAVFANPYASRSQHISSQKIAQLRLKHGDYDNEKNQTVTCMHAFRSLFRLIRFCTYTLLFVFG